MATVDDAGLILKLYELRTEAGMRKAREFVGGLQPAGFADVLALQRGMGSAENGYWRQVISYWEMAAALVLHGVLDAELFLDTNGEPFYLYAKFTPYFEEYAKAFGHPFMPKTAKMLEKFPAMQERYTMMLVTMAARHKQAEG